LLDAIRADMRDPIDALDDPATMFWVRYVTADKLSVGLCCILSLGWMAA
jgi:hypothetical protein